MYAYVLARPIVATDPSGTVLFVGGGVAVTVATATKVAIVVVVVAAVTISCREGIRRRCTRPYNECVRLVYINALHRLGVECLNEGGFPNLAMREKCWQRLKDNGVSRCNAAWRRCAWTCGIAGFHQPAPAVSPSVDCDDLCSDNFKLQQEETPELDLGGPDF